MKVELVHVDEIKFVGLSARTSNQKEFNPKTAKIGETIQYYVGHRIADQIPDRKHPGHSLAVYTDYESNEHGEYTYFFGEEVSKITRLHSPLQSLILPSGKYAKITTVAGQMPQVVIQTWMEIWKMMPEVLGGQRTYRADFEVYDERAADPEHAVVDIYLGVK